VHAAGLEIEQIACGIASPGETHQGTESPTTRGQLATIAIGLRPFAGPTARTAVRMADMTGDRAVGAGLPIRSGQERMPDLDLERCAREGERDFENLALTSKLLG